MSTSADASAGPLRATWVCLSLGWLFFLLPLPGLSISVGSSMCFVAFILSIVVLAKGNTSGGLATLLLTILASPIVYAIGWGIFALVVQKGMLDLHDQGYGLTSPR